MRYIEKNTVAFPEKLNGVTTEERRNELIAANEYLGGNKYNSRYKTDDVKKNLEKLYKNKCAFCETNIERWDVEHFRPKSLYPWLAYSWDNLLLACPTCNGHKNNHFELINEKAKYKNEDLENIHSLAKEYDLIENNKFVHPELETEIVNKLIFDSNGKVSSTDEKVKYTIKTCKLDREKLNIERKKQVLNQYEVELQVRFAKYGVSDKLKNSIADLREAFKVQAEDLENNFTAFRQYALKNIIL